MTVTDDLTSAPIPSLIRGIAIPASIGAVFNTLFNIVDSWFAGFISTQALAALGLSFPVFFCIIAMGMGVATGSTAILSNALGAKKREDVRLFAIQANGCLRISSGCWGPQMNILPSPYPIWTSSS